MIMKLVKKSIIVMDKKKYIKTIWKLLYKTNN